MSRRGLRVWRVWTRAHLQRMVRDDIVLRALLAPPVVLAGTLALTGAVVATGGAPGPVAVASDRAEQVLVLADVAWVRVDDVDAALAAGATDRGLVRRGEAWQIESRPSGWARWSGNRMRADLELEAAVREVTGAQWRLALPPTPDRGPTLAGQVSMLARVLSVLYTLYAVVLAAAATVRDRQTGVLEATSGVPVSKVVRPASRLAALVVAVGGVLVATQLLVGVLLGHGQPLLWGLQGLAAVVVGAALGLVAPAGRGLQPRGPLTGAPDGLSTPLSHALVAVTTLGGVGVGAPVVGAWLPVAGLAAGDGGLSAAVCGCVVAVVVALWSVRRAGRAGW